MNKIDHDQSRIPQPTELHDLTELLDAAKAGKRHVTLLLAVVVAAVISLVTRLQANRLVSGHQS